MISTRGKANLRAFPDKLTSLTSEEVDARRIMGGDFSIKANSYSGNQLLGHLGSQVMEVMRMDGGV